VAWSGCEKEESDVRAERIQSVGDPRLALYRTVRDGELVRSAGLFVAEGRHIVRRVIESGRHRVQSILVNEAALHDLEPSFAQLGADVPIFVGDAKELAATAGYDVHRGCLALVVRPEPASIDAVMAEATLIAVLEGVANADNVGGIFRNAAAFGAGGVLLTSTCCDPLYRKAIRTSMGATLQVPFAYIGAGDWPLVLAQVEAAGFTTVALTPRLPSDTLDAFAARPRSVRLALIVGTEGAGLTPAVAAAAHHRVRIPISDAVDSLNVAVAAGIVMSRLQA
jgi:tRNA G18 (ribose-2'-O)-methylase SpoU